MHTYVNIGYTCLSCFFSKSRGGLSGWRKNLWYFFRWVNIYPHGHHLLLTIFWTQHRLSSGSSHGPSGKAACSQTATDVLFTQLQSTMYLGSPGLSIMTGKKYFCKLVFFDCQDTFRVRSIWTNLTMHFKMCFMVSIKINPTHKLLSVIVTRCSIT